MKKLAKYNNYNLVTQVIIGEEKKALLFTESIPVDYTDIHTIENLSAYGARANMDFQQIHAAILGIAMATGFEELTLPEKQIVANYCAYDDETLVTFYATVETSGDLEAALEIHADKIGVLVSELQVIAESRISSPFVKVAIMKYLKDRSQIDLFMAAIRNFISDYKFKFHLGVAFGDSTDGLLDYLGNTGGYSEDGTGLDSYEFSDLYKGLWYAANAVDPNNPTSGEQKLAHNYVRDLLKNKLINILVNGINE